jgi:hypothetical protein
MVADRGTGPAGLVSQTRAESSMTVEWELGEDESPSLSHIEGILKELELLKRVHLQALFARGESGEAGNSANLDDSQIKKVTSYLRLVEEMVRILERRDKIRESMLSGEAPLRVVLQVLREIPLFRDALDNPDIREQIMILLRKKLCDKNLTQESESSEPGGSSGHGEFTGSGGADQS